MTPSILRHLLLKIPVEGLLAADKAAAVVVRAEQIDTRRGLRRRHLQCHRFLIAARGRPQGVIDRRRIEHPFGEGSADRRSPG